MFSVVVKILIVSLLVTLLEIVSEYSAVSTPRIVLTIHLNYDYEVVKVTDHKFTSISNDEMEEMESVASTRN